MKKRILLVVLCFLGSVPFALSQDSIPPLEDALESKNLKFQEYFFKALSEKAIQNYQKAISNLEMCYELLPNEPIVYFELSKNYLLLQRNTEALEFINKALNLVYYSIEPYHYSRPKRRSRL